MIADARVLALAADVVDRARTAGRTLATAESLTGGLLGAVITSVPGASDIYRGGLITYATDLKATLGGADPETLRRDGAVSASTAEALAAGCAHRCGADLALALTGVAGPGMQENQPAGTVWLGWFDEGQTDHRLLRFAGERGEIRADAVEAALQQAQDLLAKMRNI